MPPNEYRIIDKDDLLRKFVDEQWSDKLARYPCEEYQYGYRKTIRKWFNDEGDLIAETREYRNPTGVNTVVRQLRDGEIMYYVP